MLKVKIKPKSSASEAFQLRQPVTRCDRRVTAPRGHPAFPSTERAAGAAVQTFICASPGAAGVCPLSDARTQPTPRCRC